VDVEAGDEEVAVREIESGGGIPAEEGQGAPGVARSGDDVV
jgi:hypothetical protein